jgi:crotonobetainyl-CoA:carnitine CoA-transferase CaiB-like acyl-CoA transferase
VSLFWFATNTSKRGTTLDGETHEGNKIFKKLVGTADIVPESFELGFLSDVQMATCQMGV